MVIRCIRIGSTIIKFIRTRGIIIRYTTVIRLIESSIRGKINKFVEF